MKSLQEYINESNDNQIKVDGLVLDLDNLTFDGVSFTQEQLNQWISNVTKRRNNSTVKVSNDLVFDVDADSPSIVYKNNSYDLGKYWRQIKSSRKINESKSDDKRIKYLENLLGKKDATITLNKNKKGDVIVYVNGQTAFNLDDPGMYKEELRVSALLRAFSKGS